VTTSIKQLPVDLEELCIALEAEAGELRWYLDLHSGDVILVSAEYDPNEYGGLTREAIEGAPDRFHLVLPQGARDAVEDMRAFASQLEDSRLKESLELALEAPRPDRRFRAVLGWLPEELERWHTFRNLRCSTRAREWLQTLGVEAVPRG